MPIGAVRISARGSEMIFNLLHGPALTTSAGFSDNYTDLLVLFTAFLIVDYATVQFDRQQHAANTDSYESTLSNKKIVISGGQFQRSAM